MSYQESAPEVTPPVVPVAPSEATVVITKAQYQQLEKLLLALDRSYGSIGRLFWRSVVAGIGQAFGLAITYLLIFSAIAYILQSLGIGKTLQENFKNYQNSFISEQLTKADTASASTTTQVGSVPSTAEALKAITEAMKANQ